MAKRRRRRIPKAVRIAVIERDGHRCRYCGSTFNLTFDHVVPHSKGGEDTVDNLVIACKGCNSRKGTKTLRDFQDPFIAFKAIGETGNVEPYEARISETSECEAAQHVGVIDERIAKLTAERNRFIKFYIGIHGKKFQQLLPYDTDEDPDVN